MSWYLMVLKKYVVFGERARRKEFWYFALISFIISVILSLIDTAIGMNVLGSIYGLAVLLPSIAVGARRLHDTGRTGWWLLIGFIPLVGTIILIIFFAIDSQPGENKYGPSSKDA